ncbi:MAG: Gfo/Idh/MocA family oxidoreductase [Aliishimia sp.]
MANRGGDVSRLLVMGGGLIGRRHVERILAHSTATCVGLVDPNPQAAVDLDVPRLDTLTAANADGIIIATPTPLHAEHGAACAKAGLAMLIEKPVTGTLAQADELEAHARDVPVLVGHHRRHHPKVKALTDVLSLGQIGTPVTASMIWAMRKPDDYFAGNWRAQDGSPVLINLVHDLDLMRLWFGPVAQIAALPGSTLRGAGRIESGAVALRFENGLSATISFADTAASPWGFEAGTGENPNIGTTTQDMLWITGTKGGVSFPSLTVWQGEDWSRPAKPAPQVQVTGPAPLDAQLDHFLDVISGRAAPVCSLADGRAALATALEIEAQLHQKAA